MRLPDAVRLEVNRQVDNDLAAVSIRNAAKITETIHVTTWNNLCLA